MSLAGVILLITVLLILRFSPKLSEKIFGGLFDIVYDSIAELFKSIYRKILKIIKKEQNISLFKAEKIKAGNKRIFMTEVRNIKCPCCGYFTIVHDYEIIVEICDVCGWQYDIAGQENPNKATGPNKVSLNEAKRNYKQHKVSDIRFLANNWTREPLADELPENNI